MNPEEINGVLSEIWQNGAQVKCEIKMSPSDKQVEEATDTSMLSTNNTATMASITSSFKRNKLQTQFVAELPVDIKADKNIDTGQLTEYSPDSNNEFKNGGTFSLNKYIKSEPTTSVKEESKPFSQVKNSQFRDKIIKEENFAETKVVISEEVYIKSENEENNQSDIMHTRVEAEERNHTSNKNDPLSGFKQCPHCPYKNFYSYQVKIHQLVHASKEEVELHKCPKCPFTSKWKKSLTYHSRRHEKLNGITWYRCPECPYKTKRKDNLEHFHMLRHRKGVLMHQCVLCSYESSTEQSVQNHLNKVHRSKDTEPIGCPEVGCLFKTHDKSNLAQHVKLIHKSHQIFKCLKCSYQTKFARNFQEHALRYESPDKWLSCSLCPYKTPQKHALNIHSLQHKSDGEIKWFHCLECSFKSKYKSDLNQHKLVHNRVLEKLVECSKCCFKTATAQHLRRHMLTHKEPGSETWFHCAQCPYKATRKIYLTQHLYKHKSERFRCTKCPYKSHQKRALELHQLGHRRPEDITDWYYCYICTWKTVHKNSLPKHINRQHRDAEGRIFYGSCADDK